MSRVKSTNEVASIQLGLDSQWVHLATSFTGRYTIAPRNSGTIIVLIKVIINKKGSSNPLLLTDSITGVIASLDPTDATAGQYPYNLPITQNGFLYIDNAGGADVTVIYKNR